MLKFLMTMKPLKLSSSTSFLNQHPPPCRPLPFSLVVPIASKRSVVNMSSERMSSLCCDNRSISSRPTFNPGEIHVIMGPMFSGKTTTLLRRVQSEIDTGRKVAVIKSNKDKRYGLDFAATHDGVKLPCWAIHSLSAFQEVFGEDEYKQLDVIGIDEAQFFEDLYNFCRVAADYDGKRVIVAGLDGDYRRRRFGCVMDVLPLADSVTKLSSKCGICNEKANFTLRKTEDRETELIGGADIYMPVCRRHYIGGHVALEAAREVTESRNFKALLNG